MRDRFSGYRDCRLEKICIFVNDKPIDELSALCPGVNAKAKAAEIVKKLADEIPQHQFEVMVKACLGTASKAVAQRKIKAMKKDFTGVLKGGQFKLIIVDDHLLFKGIWWPIDWARN